jgi:O-antigen/teichoic acid export membrane protein
MVALLLALTPPMVAAWGIEGAAAAWVLANAPFSLWSIARLRAIAKEVSHAPAPLRGRADVE